MRSSITPKNIEIKSVLHHKKIGNSQKTSNFLLFQAYLLTYVALQPCVPVLSTVSTHLWPIGPDYRCSVHPPSAHVVFGFPWFLLPLGLALNRAFCGRSSGLLIMWPAWRNLLTLFLVHLCTLLVKPSLYICLFSRDGVCSYSLHCFFQFFTFLGQLFRSRLPSRAIDPWRPLRSHLLVHACWWESNRKICLLF
jgi:hypothetical protein